MLRTNPDLSVKEELIIVFTHNENQHFRKYAQPLIDPEIITVDYIDEGQQLKTQGEVALKALLEKFNKLTSTTNYKLITFLMDFNLGYTGHDLCPVQPLITALLTKDADIEQTLSQLGFSDAKPEVSNNYVFVKTREELAAAKNAGQTPFRVVLTGGGGFVAEYPGKSEPLNRDDARIKYSFEAFALTKFIGSIRQLEGSPVSVCMTPQSATRRLPPAARKISSRGVTSTASSDAEIQTPSGSPVSSSTSSSTIDQRVASVSSTATTMSVLSTTAASPESSPGYVESELLRTSSPSFDIQIVDLLTALSTLNVTRSSSEGTKAPTIDIRAIRSTNPSSANTSPTFFGESTSTPKLEKKRPSPIATPERKVKTPTEEPPTRFVP